MSDTAAEYIAKRVADAPNPAVASTLSSIQALYEGKLWHQLTEEVKKAMEDPAIPDKRGLYDSFLHHFEKKLNPVSLVQIVSSIVRAELQSSPSAALEFIAPLHSAEKPSASPLAESPEANVLILSLQSTLHMAASDKPQSKKAIENAREIVDSSHDMLPSVHSAFYEAAAEYHKVEGTASDFFRNALQFLAYTPPNTLPADAQRRWAFDIGMAALVGTDVYNFGEVVSRAIMQSLRGTEHDWLLSLLEAFDTGDLALFDRVCTDASAQMNAQQVLVAHEEFLKQKITILALMELAFARNVENSITFAEIERACRLPPKEVEYLLMRAMSLGLISGIIDNVSETVTITRVQPRVLGRKPIGVMANRLKEWTAKVNTTVSFLNQRAVGLIEAEEKV